MTKGLVVLIDALAARTGGTAYASISIARELAGHEQVARVLTVTRAGSLVAEGLRGRGVDLILLPQLKHYELGRRVAWETLRLPSLVRECGADGLVTFSGMVPRPVACPIVAHLSNPVMFEVESRANRLRRWAVATTAARGSDLLVPSHSMAALVQTGIGHRPRVAPFGLDREAFWPGPSAGHAVLCVADFYRHKRHDLVLDAWAALPAPRPQLRLVGDPAVDPQQAARIRSQATALSAKGTITFAHRLTLKQLADAYRSARVCVMPSQHESFCMPVAEALACGVPVLARDLSALRETAGGGAVYVSGDNPSDWSSALNDLARDDRRHAGLRRAGIAHAARYSWRAVAETMIEALGRPGLHGPLGRPGRRRSHQPRDGEGQASGRSRAA